LDLLVGGLFPETSYAFTLALASGNAALATAPVFQQQSPATMAIVTPACEWGGGVWRVACGVWRVACGVWRVACGVWRVAYRDKNHCSDNRYAAAASGCASAVSGALSVCECRVARAHPCVRPPDSRINGGSTSTKIGCVRCCVWMRVQGAVEAPLTVTSAAALMARRIRFRRPPRRWAAKRKSF
jgi:hypothetical protein